MSKEKPKKPKKNVEEYSRRLPPPPKEHAYELKMEKRLKHMLEEKKEKDE